MTAHHWSPSQPWHPPGFPGERTTPDLTTARETMNLTSEQQLKLDIAQDQLDAYAIARDLEHDSYSDLDCSDGYWDSGSDR